MTISSILNNCEHEATRNIFQTGFWTGMRPGELFALKWSDIDFLEELIHVSKSVGSKGQLKETKTEAGIRNIEMTPKAKEALINQLQITGNDADQIIFKTPVHHVPWKRPSALGVYWKEALSIGEVRYRNLYQTRCTFISTMLTLGNSPMILYPMVGHRTPKTIYEHYARFVKSGKKLLKLEEDEE